MKLLVLFVVLSVVNVILQTFKSIATIKCGKLGASVVNACAYGLYTVVLIFTNADFPLWQKVLVTAITNFIGVFIVKSIEEKVRKDKLWLVKMTIPKSVSFGAREELRDSEISFSKIETDGFDIYDCYCNTQKETEVVLRVAKKFNGKTFATENKLF